MTDEPETSTAPDADLPEAAPRAEAGPAGPQPTRPGPPLPPPTRRVPDSSADVRPRRPDYRGEELDPERGPGLGCFWFQVIVLGFFIVIIPVGLNLDWPFEVLALLLFVVIGLLLLTGQTVIFLLRLVAADRRSQGRRRPLASTTKTVGELEDEVGAAVAAPAADEEAAEVDAPAGEVAAADGVDAAEGAVSSPTPGGGVTAAGMFPASPTGEDALGGQPAAEERDRRVRGAVAEVPVDADEADGGASERGTEPLEDAATNPRPESFRAVEATPQAPDAAFAAPEAEKQRPDEPEPARPQEPEPDRPEAPDAAHATPDAEPDRPEAPSAALAAPEAEKQRPDEPEPDRPEEPDPGVRQ